MKQITKFFLLTLVFTLLFIFGYKTIYSSLGSRNPTSLLSPITNLIVSPTPVVADPVKLVIPKIDINTDIEKVGLDAKNNMDVPKNVFNVAWYQLGYKPGTYGNAVIAGHLDSPNGPAIFYNLAKLENGDQIDIIAADGHKYVYQVDKITVYPYNQLPIGEIFGPSQEKILNLITCEGTFDRNAKNYSHRVVVSATSK